jgi:hypothetical protein
VRAARVDANQAELVAVAERMGCTVRSLARVGEGVPDLLIGQASRWGRRNLLIEVKSSGSAVLTPDQIRFHRDWHGQVDIVRTVDELLIVLRGHPA